MYSKLLLSQKPTILNNARFIQFSRIRLFVEDKDIASTAKNKNGKQYDFNSSTEMKQIVKYPCLMLNSMILVAYL